VITEWLVTVGLSIVTWIGNLFHPFVFPPWMLDPTAGLYSFLNSAAGLGVWMPFAALSLVLTFTAAVFAAMMLAKVLMRVWSMLPVIGGGGG
jgi:hypothetical protein